ncbi:hypothetical protein NMG60_11013610 [Bertholletia excelsa]
MALLPFPVNSLSAPSDCSSSSSVYALILHPRAHCLSTFRTLKFRVHCSEQTIHLDTPRKKRKPKPSFFDQIRVKWSNKSPSALEKLPWQGQEQKWSKLIDEVETEEEEEDNRSTGFSVSETDINNDSSVSDPLNFFSRSRVISAPWVHGNTPNKTGFYSVLEAKSGKDREDDAPSHIQKSNHLENKASFDGTSKVTIDIDESPLGLSEEKAKMLGKEVARSSSKGNLQSVNKEVHSFLGSNDKNDSMKPPWEKGGKLGSVNVEGFRKSNTILAEKLIPDPELKRLRNVALRMVERIKVGAAGITQELVDSIHEKWNEDEVVKIKFEGPPAINMKRTHQILERRTGGLVIWRSGSSVVLYRGMTYKLPCVQSYTKQNQVNTKNSHSSRDFGRDAGISEESAATSSGRYHKDLSEEEIMDLSELNYLLDELGPRFKDWSGREPLPVDADLLPSVVPGYKPPFRLLPHGIRQGLRDKEMTFFRRTARTMPAHFVLGRNRELQGLANAMVKLWERSAIAKIAIKRGVQNTRNERMAEELKMLTGGTLLSRNKEYIVFYRGNDFLPPVLTKTLIEAEKRTALQHDEEEQARRNALMLIQSNSNNVKCPLVAGTLAETMAASLRWGNQPCSEDLEKMKRDSALARHASLVRYLEKKLALAKGKIKKAEKALAKVQVSLAPAELPTDLETISDEERFLFRKIGLSMKPYLLLGRRGIFDGTIENMHLSWKYRELVKIIVKRKSFLQVKHIAISLEAESGGVLVSLEKTVKGYAIILYRGKNYQRPHAVRPKNLLTRRQALARSIELQRREALKHHILELTERIEKLKSELEDMMKVREIDEETFYSRMDDASYSVDEMSEDEDEEAYLEIYDSSNAGGDI